MILLLIASGCNTKNPVVRIAVTTDVHGMIYPYDLIGREGSNHSLSHIYNYISEQYQLQDTIFFLLDNGDFLQGQPTVYYYNFIDTTSAHLSARVMNYMKYVAGTVGNHDIDAGPAVYDKVLSVTKRSLTLWPITRGRGGQQIAYSSPCGTMSVPAGLRGRPFSFRGISGLCCVPAQST